jgi:nitrate reductase gamma subunit
MAFTSDLGVGVIENLAADRAREFLRPKTPIEQLQLIVMVLWFLLAVLSNDYNLQFIIFNVLILLIILNTFRAILIKETEFRPLLGSILRLGIFYGLFIWFKFNFNLPSDPPVSFSFNNQLLVDNIFLFQQYTMGVLFIFGIFTNKIHLKLLTTGKRDDYFDFIGDLLSAIALIALSTVIFNQWKFLPKEPFNTVPSDLFGFSILEMIILIGLLTYFIGSISPRGQTYRRLKSAQSLVLIQNTQLERLRFAALSTGLIIIILDLLSFLNELPNVDVFKNIGLVLFVIGLLLFIFEAGTRRRGMRTDFWDSLKKGQVPSADIIKQNLPESINQAKESIKDKIIDPESQQFYKLNKDISVIDKEKVRSKLVMKKDAVAVPVSESKDGVTVVFVGDSELQDKEKSSEDTGATTLLIPNNQWQDIYSNLEAIKPSDEMVQTLALKGIETKEKLITYANQALDNFKNWQGPKAMVAEANIKAIIDSVQSGKYGVVEEKGYTKVRFPGITVIESPEITFVNIMGFIKVLEIPSLGLSSVNVPFVKVMESQDYEFVQGPGFTVLESPEGEIVNVLGMNFSEGNKQLVASKIKQIGEDQESLNRLMAGPLEEILEDPNKILALTQSLSGDKKMLMSGKTNTIIEDASSAKFKKKKRKKEKHSHRERERQGKRVKVTFDTKSDEKVKVIHEDSSEIVPKLASKSQDLIKSGAKTLVIKEQGDLPICKMCDKEVNEGGIRCPHCSEFFHKSHYLTWVRDTGECYSCKKPLDMEFE